MSADILILFALAAVPFAPALLDALVRFVQRQFRA